VARTSSQTKDSLVRVGEVDLLVSDWGGDGETIFFGHPTGFLGKIWKPVIDCMRARGFGGRILTYDQRGQGMSSKLDEGYSWRELVNDLEGLLDTLGVVDAVGVGHSAGATINACAAASRPSCFRRLILIDPILAGSLPHAGIEHEDGGSSMARRTRTRRLVYESRAAIFDAFRNRSPYDTWTEEALRSYVEFGVFDRPDRSVELLCPSRIEAQLYDGALKIDPLVYMRKLRVPVLLVGADNSNSLQEPLLSMAREALADHRYVEFVDATHFVPMERPDEVAELILAECNA
jgi:pimeloyl-ACP methyl ester carboxylesterase